MKPGQESRTAVLVCMGRAAAHGAPHAARFADPTALALLPDDARVTVQRFRAGTSRGVRERIRHRLLGKQSNLMIVRTIEIDDAILGKDCPQVVILGAGLDGRAWRMAGLRDAVVFEVDHPASQRAKQARIAASGLTRTAREVRFVPVDFTRDSLDRALAAAGHDPESATTWVWEGVVMYLTRAEIDASLAVIHRRSVAGGRVIVAYHAPALFLRLSAPFLRGLGEPLRSEFTPDAMRALLASYGFHTVRDGALPAIAATLSAELGRATRGLDHFRIAVADLAGLAQRVG